MVGFPRDDAFNSRLLDELFQMLFLLLPLTQLEHHIYPPAVIMVQDVHGSLALLLWLHRVDFLALLSLAQSPSDLHGLHLVGFGPFHHLILHLAMDHKLGKDVLTHPLVNLLVHLSTAWLSHRSSCLCQEFQVFG